MSKIKELAVKLAEEEISFTPEQIAEIIKRIEERKKENEHYFKLQSGQECNCPHCMRLD